MTIIVENNKTTVGSSSSSSVDNNNNDAHNKDVIAVSNASTSQIADKPNLNDNEKYIKNYNIYTNDWIYQQRVPGRPYYNFDLEDLQKFKRDDKPWF